MKRFELKFLFALMLFLGFNFFLPPVLAYSYVDSYLNLNGSSSYTTLGNVLNFDSTDTFAFNIYIKTSSSCSPGSSWCNIFNKQENSGNFRGYSMFITDAGKINFQILSVGGGSNGIEVVGDSVINDGVWHKITMQYDGSKDVSGLRVWVDEILDSLTVNQNNLTGSILNSESWIMGKRGSGYYFNGEMGLTAISGDISGSYTASSWQYANCSGNQVFDAFHNNTMTLSNTTCTNASGMVIVYPQEGDTYTSMPNNLTYSYTNVNGVYNVAQFHITKKSPWGLSYPYQQVSIASSTAGQVGSISVSLQDGEHSVWAQLKNTGTGAVSTPFSVGTFFVSATTSAPFNVDDFINMVKNGTSTPTATSTNYFNTSAHNLACTDDEWATPDPSVDWIIGSSTLPFLNITRWKCSIKEMLLDIPQMFAKLGSSAMTGAATMLVQVFPFNIPINFYNSWEASDNVGFPEELGYFDSIIDASGNLYLPIPSEWTGAAATTTPVFGPAVFTSNTAMASFFAGVRVFSKYLMWILFIYAVYALGISLYEEFNGAVKKGEN